MSSKIAVAVLGMWIPGSIFKHLMQAGEPKRLDRELLGTSSAQSDIRLCDLFGKTTYLLYHPGHPVTPTNQSLPPPKVLMFDDA
jgi:hypothetical protein